MVIEKPLATAIGTYKLTSPFFIIPNVSDEENSRAWCSIPSGRMKSLKKRKAKEDPQMIKASIMNIHLKL